MLDKNESVTEAWNAVVADQQMLEDEKKKLGEAEKLLEVARSEVVRMTQVVEDGRRHLEIDTKRLFKVIGDEVGIGVNS